MKHLLITAALIVILAITAACSQDQRAALQTAVAVPGASVPSGNAVAQAATPAASPEAFDAPAFSALVTPTPLPTMPGPMGTLTAIADLIASPTQNAEPYTIVNRGNPHFIEFHAWW